MESGGFPIREVVPLVRRKTVHAADWDLKLRNRLWIAGILLAATLLINRYTCSRGSIPPHDVQIASERLNSTIAKYKASGYPWVVGDLSRNTMPGENGAYLVRDAEQLLAKTDLSAKKSELENLAGKGDYLHLRKRLEAYSRVTELADRAATKRAMDFEKDWSLGPEMSTAEATEFKPLIFLLCLSAESNVDVGPKRMLAELENASRLSTLFSQQGSLIHLLVGLGAKQIVVRFIGHCASRCKDARIAADLKARLEHFEVHVPLDTVLKHEAYLDLVVLRNLSLYGGPDAVSRGSVVTTTLAPDRMRRDCVPSDPYERAFMERDLRYWIYLGPASRFRSMSTSQVIAEIHAANDRLASEPSAVASLDSVLYRRDLFDVVAAAEQKLTTDKTRILSSLAKQRGR